jgi:hypothetical protein
MPAEYHPLLPLVAYVRKHNRQAAPDGQSRGPVLAGVVGDPIRMQGVIWHISPRQEENCRRSGCVECTGNRYCRALVQKRIDVGISQPA